MNHFIELRSSGVSGKGLFAKDHIPAGTCIASFDGELLHANRASQLPNEWRDHALQVGPIEYRTSKGIAHFINHSCSPNCGIRNLIDLVTMKDVSKNEELTLDYEMSERSDWSMDCHCGSEECRKVIGSYDNLPLHKRLEYQGFVSEWLLQ